MSFSVDYFIMQPVHDLCMYKLAMQVICVKFIDKVVAEVFAWIESK